MSWELALSVGFGLFEAVSSISQRQSEAKRAQFAAEQEQQAFLDERQAAKVDALDQEVERLREARFLYAQNLNAAGAGADLAPSVLAINRYNTSLAGDDIANIRLLGARQAYKYGKSADNARIEAGYYASQRKFTVFDGIGLVAAAAAPAIKSGVLGPKAAAEPPSGRPRSSTAYPPASRIITG